MENVKRSVMIFFAAFLFVMAFQGCRGLWERDEGRYTDIALNMLRTKDFEIPRLNKTTPHFAKPPLTYWLIAGGISILGKNEWGARLPNSIAFSLTVLLLFLIAKEIEIDPPILPSLLYATSIFPYLAANFITTDTILTFFELLGVYGFIKWWNNRFEFLGPIIMWSAFGFAFLTKGPPGILPLLSIVVFLFLTKRPKGICQLFNPIGIFLFISIGLGWFMLIIGKYPSLFKYFIVDEVFKRMFTSHHHRNPEWYKPFIIYLPILIFGVLPWTKFLFNKLKKSKIFSIKWWRDCLNNNPIEAFLFLWLLIPLAIFFMAKSRLPLYILPLFPPLCLIISNNISINMKAKSTKFYLTLWILLIFTLKFTMSKISYAMDSRAMSHIIEKLDPHGPKEIKFINTVPFWGLTLYLDCEVYDIAIHKKEDVIKEYALDKKKLNHVHIIYVINKKHKNKLLLLLKDIPLKKMGEYKSWIFFRNL